jgi:peptidoglycan/xylan/chitin deacetylase (PgdA/CDA1 family)
VGSPYADEASRADRSPRADTSLRANRPSRPHGTSWPRGARAAVSITFDNLGEAAEVELGLRDPQAPHGGHYSVTTALPIVLSELARTELRATFFVEGVNAETYPEALRDIDRAGHELAYHAWCHEDWSTLDADAEVANLDRGLAAFAALGIEAVGMRPPGGRLTGGSLPLLGSRGLTYCSPAGSAPGIDRIAVLPFAWDAVDAFHVLPAFAALRERLTGSPEPGGPTAVAEATLRRVEDALASGGHAMLVLHTWLIELERDAVSEILDRVCELVAAGELWAAPCREVAAWIGDGDRRGGATPILGPPVLDHTSWTAPA